MLAETGVLRQARMLLVLVVVALPFGVAACGGDDGDNAAGTVTVDHHGRGRWFNDGRR